MTFLQSSAIEAVAYDEAAHRLSAKFRVNGEVVVYEDVPPELFDSLIFADSIGAFFRTRIEGNYRAHKA